MTNDVIADLLEQLVSGQKRSEEWQKQSDLRADGFATRLEETNERIDAVARQALASQSAKEDHAKALEDLRREMRERARKSSEDLSEHVADEATRDAAVIAHLDRLHSALEVAASAATTQAPMLERVARQGRPIVPLVGGFAGSAVAVLMSELARNPSIVHDVLRALGLVH